MFFFSPDVKVNIVYFFSLKKKVPYLFDIYLRAVMCKTLQSKYFDLNRAFT